MSHFKQNEHEKVFFINGRDYPACIRSLSSDELANGGRNGEVAASFSVQLPGNGNNAVTRAATAGDGNR